ncbi:unnamed protein product [Lymnaea stagnalis]|uniref:EF-hand domain-containing protein n=1 Tax=Lymnaea stagnalis TaxID=6523 RepID=A0AAV2HSU0_LYMST
MKNMHFFRGFLISVLPLALAQLPELTSLTYYQWAQRAFDWLDTNDNNTIERIETIYGFHRLRGLTTPGDEITVATLRDVNGHQGIACPVAYSVLEQFDADNDTVITVWDFKRLWIANDRNNDSRITADEFIRAIDRILTTAGVPENFGIGNSSTTSHPE